MSNPQKICVILHLFYQDMWNEIKDYLSSLKVAVSGGGGNIDIFITCVEANNELFNEILSFADEKTKINIEQVENTKGADLYPFIHVLNKINLDAYNILYKLHTKRTIPKIRQKLLVRNKLNLKFYIGRNVWRNFLYNAILGKHNITKVLDIFENNQKAGIIGFYPLLTKFSESAYTKPDNFEEITVKNKFKRKKKWKHYAGTIFVIRANLLKCIQNKFSINDFKLEGDDKFVEFAYFLEVFLGYIVEAQGYKFISIYSFFTSIILSILTNLPIGRYNRLCLYRFYINKFIFKRNVLLQEDIERDIAGAKYD
ncbi:MAG: rhamnan synthesis F family protein [Candidatus Avigastranaerophilus sp.]